eukprot:11226781-Lingulodinium_polyedra.AAC.1
MGIEELLRGHGIPDDITEKLKDKPYSCTTVSRFANYFDDRTEIRSLFATKIGLEDGAVISELKQAWREAEAMFSRSLQCKANNTPEQQLEDPLSAEVQSSIVARWKLTYSFILPPAWRGPDSMLGRFYREFTKGTHVMYGIRKVRSQEQVTAGGPSVRKEQLGNGTFITYGVTEAAHDVSIT